MPCLRRQVARPPAFTLVEVLVVIAIIGIMAALMVGVTREIIRQAYIKETGAKLAVIHALVERYQVATGEYPEASSTEALVSQLNRLPETNVEALVGKEFGRGGTVRDSWKHEIKYVYDSSGSVTGTYAEMFLENNCGPLLVSPGPNGNFDLKDDVVVPSKK